MEDVFHYIEQNQAQYIRWLQEICRQPSVAAQNRGMDETAKMVLDAIHTIGGQAELIETSGYPVILGTFGKEGLKTLSFYNHYDVQPEDPVELWDYPPFGAEIHDGKMVARGVADNKGNLMARLAAIHAYQQVRGELPLSIKFIVEGEEEIGSVHLEEFIEKHGDRLHADGCLWEFGYKNANNRPQISLGVKGMCYVELVCRGANTDLHSSTAAIIENPAWRLVWALSTLKTPDEKVCIPGFYDNVLPPDHLEKQILDQMEYEEKETLQHLELESFLSELSGFDLKEKLIFQPTCTICGFESGYTGTGAKTVLPAEARVKLDFRLVPEQDPEEILTHLRTHLDQHGFEDIDIIPYSLEHPAKTSPSDPLVDTVRTTARQVYQTDPVVMPMSPGTGPMYSLCQKRGIPAVSVGVGHFASNNHAPNENIFVEDYVQGIKHIAAIIEDFAQREAKGANG
ncbi:M20/M25/M40 family metallo-hydrolase [Desmospora activa]|uniref:Acetylornithine deacetylase/succinyl-diaminopimelate desuccinylase-like protein n=1 Tax=Desmospora activa DSM 45169 TaxID=1121389 RepID=A0A2T4ZAZ6_9BACL|nr:M20/M25/M40 family metallo-hydrolase [Desmospora activa]PTM59059.1 acetylornithine deacetylase/succinyl-diaminopimelate desuccinylase-like protein [Desmospora activa DSM 45169]